jgi:hypothetical protein
MAVVTIPLSLPTQRKDGTALTPAEIARLDIEFSTDNGQTFTNVGHAAANQTSFSVSDLSVGSYLARGFATDTQTPPLTSDPSPSVSFTVAAPALAAPNPPTLGAPVVS